MEKTNRMKIYSKKNVKKLKIKSEVKKIIGYK
jgi:hypothetical protein